MCIGGGQGIAAIFERMCCRPEADPEARVPLRARPSPSSLATVQTAAATEGKPPDRARVRDVARRPKIGFVLGAGSARGWAHIGVLRALSEAGIKPDLIAGCSVGALVGAAFAADRLDQLEAWARALDWKRVLRLLDFSLRGGLIKGKRVREVFREQFVECEFSELQVPFAAGAIDLHSGQEIWLREGRVSAAIGASIAVP